MSYRIATTQATYLEWWLIWGCWCCCSTYSWRSSCGKIDTSLLCHRLNALLQFLKFLQYLLLSLLQLTDSLRNLLLSSALKAEVKILKLNEMSYMHWRPKEPIWWTGSGWSSCSHCSEIVKLRDTVVECLPSTCASWGVLFFSLKLKYNLAMNIKQQRWSARKH